VAILVMGLSQALEGEEGEMANVGDRSRIELPDAQEDLIKAIHATGTPVVLVLINGSPLAVKWANENVAAIVEAWYPGQAAGTAIADVLFGDYNPGGRLPITFHESTEQLPPFADYSMQGRTYRYMTAKPLYPFGYGLSYTEFAYSDLQVRQSGKDVEVSVTVRNSGKRAGDEVVQLYVRDVDAAGTVPLRHLEGFTRIHLQPGETKSVTFTLKPEQIARVNAAGERVIAPGAYEISVGGGQPGYTPGVQTAPLTYR
jgi:beta-glucosidase